MADINKFIDDLGADVGDTYSPRILEFVLELGKKIVNNSTAPATAFLTQLITEVINERRDEVDKFVRDQVRERFDENRDEVETFINSQIKDIVSRYQPEVLGNLKTKIVSGGIQLTSEDIRLVITNSKTTTEIARLDIPVNVNIKVDELFVELKTEELAITHLDIK
jgi:hypothetical protein